MRVKVWGPGVCGLIWVVTHPPTHSYTHNIPSYTSPSPKLRKIRWWVGWHGVGGALEGVN